MWCAGPHGVPAVRNGLILCPASLVANWAKEFAKWLGNQVTTFPGTPVARVCAIECHEPWLSQ